jgi:hypothetical protein
MAQPVDSPPERQIQFVNAIDSIEPLPRATPSRGPALDKSLSSSEKTPDISDEEKARIIADEDLNGRQKQVC